ncbi:MAG: PD-(D/E)XK nuclease family protein [Deltaproteobacteria bacterium]|nr:PD-(D/E)XK nuclease family protein [Deltaproteobacteria bacterium]
MAKKPSYSFSKLETDEKCPWAYQKIYIERIPRAETEPLVIGKMLHDLTAQYLDRLIGAKLQTDWLYAEGLTPKEAPADVFDIWPRFFNSFILPPMESPGVELKLAFDRNWKPTDYFGDDAFFRMVVDWTYRQGELAVVQDWKSNRVVPETVEKNLQLRIYGWGYGRRAIPMPKRFSCASTFSDMGPNGKLFFSPMTWPRSRTSWRTGLSRSKPGKTLNRPPGHSAAGAGSWPTVR